MSELTTEILIDHSVKIAIETPENVATVNKLVIALSETCLRENAHKWAVVAALTAMMEISRLESAAAIATTMDTLAKGDANGTN